MLAHYQAVALAQAKPLPKGQSQAPDDLPVEDEGLEAPLDFGQRMDYQMVLTDVHANSETNVYLRHLDADNRFDVR